MGETAVYRPSAADGNSRAAIDMVGLSKRYGNFDAVSSVTLSVARGEVFGFLGPNGAGKTTTIRLLMGILVPTAGHALITGLHCHLQRAEVKRHVGYLPENPIFYDYLRGREIIEFIGEMHGQSPSTARRRAAHLLEVLTLSEAAEEYAINYSMGMKKKLGLACALVHDPPVLILDEPTNGLDPLAAREVRDLLLAAAGEGKTVFLSTHLLDLAERLCSRLGIIHGGRLLAVGTLAELREKLAPGGSLEDIFIKVTSGASGDGDGTAPPEHRTVRRPSENARCKSALSDRSNPFGALVRP